MAYSALAAIAQEVDTLLVTSVAKSISIQSDRRVTSVTVKRIGGGSDNFFYETGTSSTNWQNAETQIHYNDVRDVVITETNTKSLKIRFTIDDDDEISYTFSIPDPENRFVNTYIGRNGSDFGISIKKGGNTQWDLISGGWGFGWVSAIADDPSMHVNMWKSNELTWAIILGVRMTRGRSSLAMGLGIDWRNYVTKGNSYFDMGEDGKITLMPYEPGTHKHRSRIKVFSLQIPLLYGVDMGHKRNWRFNLGPILNFNTSGSIKTQYTMGDRDYSIKTHDIHQRPVTVDIFGEIKYKSIGVYVRYSPMKVMKTSTGLDFNTISTGIMLGL